MLKQAQSQEVSEETFEHKSVKVIRKENQKQSCGSTEKS
jgi:hypothetical protein